MHIGFAINPYQKYSGVGTYYQNLFLQLRLIAPDIKITVFLPDNVSSETVNFFGTENVVRMPVPDSPSWKRALYTYRYKNIETWYRGNKIDVLHSFSFPGFFCSGKNIMTVYDMRAEDFPAINSLLRNMYAKFMKSSVLRKMDGLITISEFTRKRLAHHYGHTKDKSKTIYLGGGDRFAGIDNFTPLLDVPYILAVSHIMPRKDLAVLVAAYDLLIKDSGRPHHLLIIGKKYENDTAFYNAYNSSPNKSRIHIRSSLDEEELASAYKHASIFVFPSLYEGFGIPLLEAASFGIPCIVSDASVFPEMAGANSEMMFRHGQPEDLFAKMKEILCSVDLCKNCAAKSDKISAEFTWKKTAVETLKYYYEMSREY